MRSRTATSSRRVLGAPIARRELRGGRRRRASKRAAQIADALARCRSGACGVALARPRHRHPARRACRAGAPCARRKHCELAQAQAAGRGRGWQRIARPVWRKAAPVVGPTRGRPGGGHRGARRAPHRRGAAPGRGAIHSAQRAAWIVAARRACRHLRLLQSHVPLRVCELDAQRRCAPCAAPARARAEPRVRPCVAPRGFVAAAYARLFTRRAHALDPRGRRALRPRSRGARGGHRGTGLGRHGARGHGRARARQHVGGSWRRSVARREPD